MREVKVAKSAGFCFGVKRAVEMVYSEAAKGKKVFLMGGGIGIVQLHP